MNKRQDAARPDRRDTRAALVEAAATLLATGGMAAVTLRAVGDQIGVSRTTPYRHFADKQALLAAVAAAAFTQLETQMTTAAAAHDASTHLEAMLMAYVQFGLAEPARYRLMFGPELRERDHPEVQAAAQAVHALLVHTVHTAQQAGHVGAGDPTQVAALLYATAHGGIDLTLSGHVEAAKGLGDPVQLTRALLRYLRPAEHGAP